LGQVIKCFIVVLWYVLFLWPEIYRDFLYSRSLRNKCSEVNTHLDICAHLE